MSDIVVFSVVRDFSMYKKCMEENPFLDGCELAPYDNRKTNDHISTAYNKLINTRPVNEDAWYMFAHEDFQLQESLKPHLEDLDKNVLWGPIGAATKPRFGIYYQWQLLGKIEECKKDGSDVRPVGRSVMKGTQVDTFDCQSLIVHSSLIQQHNLRFDEKLSFDLYVEDFCIQAREKANILSKILPLKARHWSGGNVQKRYYEQESYLNKKYPSSCYTGTSSWTLGGKIPFFWRLTVAVKRFCRAGRSLNRAGRSLRFRT
ncbi:MAG: hypothetical protein J6V88_02025 [Kiritimatiellae bacterium]|nr:hypothetical protein [Kiritimatiellia bacterium]